MTITILDTSTGKTYTQVSSFDEYWWTDGNGGCDCNRKLFTVGYGLDDDELCGVCIGRKQFLIIAANPMPSPDFLLLANHGYPTELLTKHGIV